MQDLVAVIGNNTSIKINMMLIYCDNGLEFIFSGFAKHRILGKTALLLDYQPLKL